MDLAQKLKKTSKKSNFEENPLPPPVKEGVLSLVMIVFITDVNISSRGSLFNLK